MTKVYGTCTGTARSKYDLWITAEENSTDITANKSNVTVKLYLKRNDGYESSAYNLTESDNTVKITVGGTVRVNKNTSIDTRGGVSFLLGSWTGNVQHNDDGSLNLSIKGEFSMSGTGLAGGNVSGKLKCTTIQRLSIGLFSSTSVNPGSTVNASVITCSTAFNHKIKWSLGEKSQTISIDAGVSNCDFTVPKAWAKQVTTSTRETLYATLYTYNGSSLLGKKVYTLNFVIPQIDEYRPEYDIAVTRVNNNVPSDFGEYVQGCSKVKVALDNISYKYDAQYKSVEITLGGVTKKSNPATFELPKSGKIQITVKLKDSRGISTVKKHEISVVAYSPPSVKIVSLERCSQDGTLQTYGTYVLAHFEKKFSSVNEKNTCTLYVKYKSKSNGTYSLPVELTGTSAIIGQDDININDTYLFLFTVYDSINTDGVATSYYVPDANIPFNIKKGGKGAAFGMFSSVDDQLSVGWDLAVNKNLTVEGNVNVGGLLYSEKISCTPTDNIENLVGFVRYYPALQLCVFRIRLKTTVKISTDTSYHIATIPNKVPSLFTAINGFVSKEVCCNVCAGIYYKTGEITLRSDKEIPIGTNIYLSGVYIADYISD